MLLNFSGLKILVSLRSSIIQAKQFIIGILKHLREYEKLASVLFSNIVFGVLNHYNDRDFWFKVTTYTKKWKIFWFGHEFVDNNYLLKNNEYQI